MAQFNYSDYQNVIAQAQSGDGNKVGFFKLKDDGDEALVRFNCASVEDLQFASVHTLQADGKWMRVSCLNPLGTYNGSCPLCNAVNSGDKRISKAGKKVYLQMLCAYKDKKTGEFSEAIPVVWERPAAFSRDIASKLKDYGDLRNTIFKITRVGQAGDMKTSYNIDFIPLYNKPETIPMDFSAFANFNIAKHSYWEKSQEDIVTFITTGKFPEAIKTTTQTAGVAPAYGDVSQYTAPQAQNVAPVQNFVPPVQSIPQVPPQPQMAPQYTPVTPVVPPVTPVDNGSNTGRVPVSQPTPAGTADNRPARNFGGFAF